jgi:WD40 repeat protein
VLIGPQFSKGPVMDFAFSQDERMIALLSSAYKLSVLNLPSLTPTKSSRGDRDALPGMYWLSDTKLCHSVKGDWHTWDPIGGGASWGAAVLGPGNNRPTVRGLIVSPDQDMAAAMAIGGPVSMVRLADSGGRFGNGNIDFDATTGAFSKDGKFIALGAKDGVLKVFNVRANNPNEVVSLVGHKGMIRAIAFTPDGQKIVSGGDDRMLRVWDAATGKELHRYPHPGTVISLVTTADNRYVISACGDSIIRMWSLSAAGDMAASK